MNYHEFFDASKNAETKHVKALFFQNSCAVTQIPSAFRLLIPYLICWMQAHLKDFCNPGEVIGLFGLQVMSVAIESSLPQKLNRIHYPKTPTYHLCVSLNYLILPLHLINVIKSWRDHQSLIVDFTTGEIMDSDRYLSLTLGIDLPGKIYGKISPKLLDQSWQLAD
jgi:hypothetical protein